jgi:hypothetical protein
MGSGEIPSRTIAVGAMPPVASGAWEDDGLDRAWRDPVPNELRNGIDRFHLPPADRRSDPSWAEWHYFNVLSSDRSTWAFISLIVGGAVPNGQWGGQVLITLHNQGGSSRKFVATVPASAVQFSTQHADLRIGTSRVVVLSDGRTPFAQRSGGRIWTRRRETRRLAVARCVFPGCGVARERSGVGVRRSSVAPDATGSICVDGRCEEYQRAQSSRPQLGCMARRDVEWRRARRPVHRVVRPSAIVRQRRGFATVFAYVVDSLGFSCCFVRARFGTTTPASSRRQRDNQRSGARPW